MLEQEVQLRFCEPRDETKYKGLVCGIPRCSLFRALQLEYEHLILLTQGSLQRWEVMASHWIVHWLIFFLPLVLEETNAVLPILHDLEQNVLGTCQSQFL